MVSKTLFSIHFGGIGFFKPPFKNILKKAILLAFSNGVVKVFLEQFLAGT